MASTIVTSPTAPVKENAVGELQEEINTLITKTNELIASSSVDPSVAALLQSMTVIIKLLSKQNLNPSNNGAYLPVPPPVVNNNAPAPIIAAPPPPPPIDRLPPLNAHTDDEHKDKLIMPLEINSEIQAKCKEMLEKRRRSIRPNSTSSTSSSEGTSSEDEEEKRPSKRNVRDELPKVRKTSGSRRPRPPKRGSVSSKNSGDKNNGCTIS